MFIICMQVWCWLKARLRRSDPTRPFSVRAVRNCVAVAMFSNPSDKSNFGRIFTKPLARSRGKNVELYVHLSVESKGNQEFPGYDACFASACAEQQWNDLMSALKDAMDAKARGRGSLAVL